MPRRHGEAKYFLVGEGLITEGADSEWGYNLLTAGGTGGTHGLTKSLGSLIALEASPAAVVGPVSRYGRMFRSPKLPEFCPVKSGLVKLGRAMEQQADPGDNPNLPAGYVYLGQFIDHDLTFDPNQDFPAVEELSPESVPNLRSPALDLDSLYGSDPDLVRQTDLGKKIYMDDGIRLRVGNTICETIQGTALEVNETFPNDLPRLGDDDRLPNMSKGQAAIVDERNDENLAVAQTHLAFIKFHNAVVDHLSGEYTGRALFEAAREKVERHYQWIILKDYLPRIIEEPVLKDVIKNGCKNMTFAVNEEPFMPVEFSVAAFRLGHSLVREEYKWNRIFEPQPDGLAAADLPELFRFTGFRGHTVFGRFKLPSSWVIDWTRFYDFTGFDGVVNSPRPNKARKFSPSIVSPLMKLTAFQHIADQDMHKLSVRNLLRGRLLGLPSGQDIARRLEVKALTPDQIAEGPHSETLKQSGFHERTPLWYYVLKEAEKLHGGEYLGPVGSRIVAETFVALIKKSRVSILPRESNGGPIWEPDLGLKAGQFSMPELLYFTHRHSGNDLNPLG